MGASSVYEQNLAKCKQSLLPATITASFCEAVMRIDFHM
ncbi:hypothetical protein BY454_11258 [Marinobacter persicus]|uniref:Uncharacterized protein n=2 Tax=Marinobacter TaxID=2742 RepID=A0A2S6G6W9_9GAMM|nr:hypothetical protein BY455_11258 [Marinobacter persicus]PPK54761.1 hypothetical protein B0H24_101028 [Marinobacter persicus]PPK58146.1 hypothetical protein BY454_11258 [Marinobacter persicus]RBP74860.1 hypothetical protein DET64_1048 [Marinobacter nauticus]RCW35391.1 hypothetical protein DET51_1048 [Marinobacter nauticus]